MNNVRMNMRKRYSLYDRTVKRMAALMLAAIVVVCGSGCASSDTGGTVIPGSAITPAPSRAIYQI